MRPVSLRVLPPLAAALLTLVACHTAPYSADDLGPPLVSENADLRTEQKLLKAELELARKEGDALRSALERKPAPDAPSSNELIARLNETTRELASLRVSYARLQADRERLQTASRVAAVPDSPRSPAAVADTVADLKARLSDTEGQLARSATNYSQLQEDNQRLRAAIESAHSENASLATQISQLTAQNDETREALAKLNAELAAQTEARAGAERKVDALAAELAQRVDSPELRQRLDDANARLADATRTATQLQDENSRLKSTVTEQHETLTAELDQARQEKAALEARIANPPEPPPELAATEAKLAAALRTQATLQSEILQLRNASADREALAAELEKARQEKTELETKLATPAAPPAELLAKLSATETQLADAARERAALSDENAQLKSAAAELEKIRQEKSDLESRLAENVRFAPPPGLAAQLNDTETRLASALQTQISLQEENAQLKSAVADREALAAELEKIRREKSDLEAKLAAAPTNAPPPPELVAQLADTETRLHDTESRLASALQAQNALQEENAQLKSASADRSSLAAELEKTRHEKSDLEQRLANAPAVPPPELVTRLSESEARLAAAERDQALLQEEIARLKATSTNDRDTLAAELEKARQENAALEARLSSAPSPAAAPSPDLEVKLTETETRLDTVLRSFSVLEAERDQLKVDAARAVAGAQGEIATANAANASQLASRLEELRRVQDQLSALAAINSELRIRLALAGAPPGSRPAPTRPGTPAAAALAQPQRPGAAPEAASAESAPRTHVVLPGETLAKISRRYYGTAARWEEIYRANRDVIKNERTLYAGSVLRIP